MVQDLAFSSLLMQKTQSDILKGKMSLLITQKLREEELKSLTSLIILSQNQGEQPIVLFPFRKQLIADLPHHLSC